MGVSAQYTPGTFSVQEPQCTHHTCGCVRGEEEGEESLMEKSWVTDTCRVGWTLDGDRFYVIVRLITHFIFMGKKAEAW